MLPLKMSSIKLGLLLWLAVPLYGFAQSGTTTSPTVATAKPSLSVQTTVLKKVKFLQQIATQGNLAAWQEVSVGSELSGVALKSVVVGLGDYVEKNAILAILEDSTLKLELRQAEAGVAESGAAYHEAVLQENRAKSLLSQGFYSQAQYDQILNQRLVAEARHASNIARVELQKRKLDQALVRSPESGKIIAKPQQIGGIVANGAELFRLVKSGRYEWRAEVSESELGKISIGQEVSLVLADGLECKGRVRALDPSISLSSRLGRVYVDIQCASRNLKSGMSAQGKIKWNESISWGVLHSALLLRDGFYYVYLLEDKLKVKQLKVQIGRRSGDMVEVLTALPENSKIVSSGVAFLADGDVVKVLPN